MKVSEVFPSYFLSGDEIIGKNVAVKIKEVKTEMIKVRPDKPEEEVISIYFEDKKRGVRLNKTRAKEIARVHGDDMDQWTGKEVLMYTEREKAFGELYNVIHFSKVDTSEEVDINDIPFGE